jgi:hypothetical protein
MEYNGVKLKNINRTEFENFIKSFFYFFFVDFEFAKSSNDLMDLDEDLIGGNNEDLEEDLVGDDEVFSEYENLEEDLEKDLVEDLVGGDEICSEYEDSLNNNKYMI